MVKKEKTLSQILQETKELEVQGEYQKAEKILDEVITYGNIENLFPALLNQRGIIRRMLGNYDLAYSDFQGVLDKGPDDEQKAMACINMADIERLEREYGIAHSSLDEALIHAGDRTLMHAKAVDQRGLVFVAQKQYDSAIYAYNKAIKICELLVDKQPEVRDNKNRLAQSLHHLGVAHFLDGFQSADAYQSQYRALQIFEELGDQQGMVNCMTTLGKFFAEDGRHAAAIPQYEKAWEILKQTKYQRAITHLAMSLGKEHLALGHKKEAIHYLKIFTKGVLNRTLTEADKTTVKKDFDELKKQYDSHNLKIKHFENVELFL